MKRVLICFFACLTVGCGDNCNDCGGGFKPPPSGPFYPPRTTPQNTVEYYRVAWENRDSTRVDSVLAVDYEGTSTDIGSTTETLSFVKFDEIRAVHRMKDDPNLVRVEVLLGPSSSWTRTSYASDPPEWVVVLVPGADIRVLLANGDILAVSSSRGNNEFKLKPVASGPDTTWEIVRWEEIHQSP